MKMFRRELPQTRERGFESNLYRRVTVEGSPFVAGTPGPSHCSPDRFDEFSKVLSDVPDEAGELAGNGDGGLCRALAAEDEPAVLAGQPLIGVASNRQPVSYTHLTLPTN